MRPRFTIGPPRFSRGKLISVSRGVTETVCFNGATAFQPWKEEAYTVVVAALCHEHVEDQQILVAYALGCSYRQIARAMHRSDWWVRRRHRAAWERVRAMLVEHGLIPP